MTWTNLFLFYIKQVHKISRKLHHQSDMSRRNVEMQDNEMWQMLSGRFKSRQNPGCGLYLAPCSRNFHQISLIIKSRNNRGSLEYISQLRGCNFYCDALRSWRGCKLSVNEIASSTPTLSRLVSVRIAYSAAMLNWRNILTLRNTITIECCS